MKTQAPKNPSGGGGVDRLRHDFGFLLRDLAQHYVARFEHHAESISLTLPQCRVLVHLERTPGLTQARLAEIAQLEPMAIVRLLDRMEAEGLVERQADPTDRRVRRLVLLPRAQAVLGEIWRLSERTVAETFAGIGALERSQFMATLERLHANLGALGTE